MGLIAMKIGSHKPARVEGMRVQMKPHKKIKYEDQLKDQKVLEHKEENRCNSKDMGSSKGISTKGTDDLSGTMMEFFAARNLDDLRQTDGKAIPFDNY